MRCLAYVGANESAGTPTLLFSGGGLGLVKCWRLDDMESRWEGSLVSEWPPASLKNSASDCRVMSLAANALPGRAHLCLVAAGYSDTMVRLFGFNLATRRLTPLAYSDFHQRCVLAVRLVATASSPVLMSSGTDGRIVMWDAQAWAQSFVEQQDELSEDPLALPPRSPSGQPGETPELGDPAFVISAHQNGINSFACRPWGLESDASSAEYLLASGGDDNALCVARLRIARDERGVLAVSTVWSETVVAAHASSITALAVLPGGGPAHNIVTSGADGRLVHWQVPRQGDLKPALVSSARVDINDVHDLDVLR